MSDLLSALIEPFTMRLFLRPLAVAVLLGASAGLVGALLLLRRLTLFADSFAHALLPGVALAWLLFGASLAALFAGALVAGLITAAAGALVARSTRLQEDAAAGAVFIALFALGVAIMSRVAAPGDLLHYLFGNLLGATRGDLWLAVAVSALTAFAVAALYRPILLECFDPVFHRAAGGRSATTHLAIVALIVLNLVAALQSVGLVLAVGLFVLPATTARLWCDRFGSLLIASSAIGAVGAAAGLSLTWHVPALPSGAGIVVCLGAAFAVSLAIAPGGLRGRRFGPPEVATDFGSRRSAARVAPVATPPDK
ncbi:zinc ABC transporter permease [Planctomycetota bacterium]|nr:zinc ABC transporter permease [Planctomycetota bacterium]